jgi:AraC-like DNA-binding protein
MEKNYDKPLKMEDYAYLTGRSLSTFRRDFKAYYDLTPRQWIKEKRLEKAVQLFQEKEKSVTDVFLRSRLRKYLLFHQGV